MQTPSKTIAHRLTTIVAAVTMALAALTPPVGFGLPSSAVQVAVAANPSQPPSPAPFTSPEITPAPSLGASTPTPDVTPALSATPAVTPDPGAAPSPSPTATPAPTPLLIPYKLSLGQQPGATTLTPIPIYKLVTPAINGSYVGSSPHVGYTFGGPDCALCHRAHDSQAPALMAGSSQSGVCFSCHGSSGGASTNIQAQFNVPANNEATDAYYSHPVNDPSTSLHVLQSDDVFANTLNRHTVCADCHNPHNATSSRPTQTTTGWTAPGNIKGVTAVAVTNGAGGSTPSYTLLQSGAVTYEYQLCIQCHSSYTKLPTRSASNPSWWALDAGVEFNPANNSVHPIEARGRNLTTQMQGSLSGTSPFKAWNYTVDSTIRCASCHGDPSTVNQTASGTPLTPDPAGQSAPHASQNRGVLIAPYRDRALKPSGEAYNAADFALCYLCHASEPFEDPNASTSAPYTNFPEHAKHISFLAGNSTTGNSIDNPGDGGGLAICAECHFRIHSTAIAYRIGDTAPTARSTGYQSLVNFSPNVEGVIAGTQPVWAQPGADGVGSCTLSCHGYDHYSSTERYTTAPAAGFYATQTAGSIGNSGGVMIQFVDATRYLSTSNGTWAWSFGDAGTSSQQSPSHVYTSPGVYTVALTVTRTGAGSLSSTLTRTGYIVIAP